MIIFIKWEETLLMRLLHYPKMIIILLSHLESRFLLPYRLANKNNFSDIDLIVSETEDITDEISEILPVTETKIIPLDKDLEMYSKHLLTNEKIQIDLLRS